MAVLALAAAAPEAIGVYRRWGAFRSREGCYAIAQPVSKGGRAGASASVGDWPARGLRNSLSIRLSRDRAAGTPVVLSIGERRFALVATTRDAWAGDAPTDRALVAAMRSARSMSVEAVEGGGRPFADTYALSGAATALDAAALACARR